MPGHDSRELFWGVGFLIFSFAHTSHSSFIAPYNIFNFHSMAPSLSSRLKARTGRLM